MICLFNIKRLQKAIDFNLKNKFIMEPFIGQIQAFGFDFAPRGWAKCDGQLLPIAQNQALFSLIGTRYGGDGRSTFGLPDLRGRVALHQGQGPGLTGRTLGQHGGTETNTLTVDEMPSHNHMATGTVKCNFNPTTPATNSSPVGGNFANAESKVYNTSPGDKLMAAENVNVVVGNNGGSRPVNNMEPYLVVNWCISLDGLFPPRS